MLTLKVPESLFKKIEHAAAERSEPRSVLVRDAIESYLGGESKSHMGAPSSLSLVKRFAGMIEGPPDLSCNSEHMRGYGE